MILQQVMRNFKMCGIYQAQILFFVSGQIKLLANNLLHREGEFSSVIEKPNSVAEDSSFVFYHRLLELSELAESRARLMILCLSVREIGREDHTLPFPFPYCSPNCKP